MEVELIEIREFLAGLTPFDHLPEEALDQLPRELSVRYLRRGSKFPPADGGGTNLYIVRTGAIELRDPAGELVDKVGEGELYSAACVGTEERQGSDLQGHAAEDCLLYLMPCSRLGLLREQYLEFDAYFTASLRARLQRALMQQKGTLAAGASLSNIPVRSLVARAPVTLSVDSTVGDAARRMTEEGISSLLLLDQERLVGLLTDSDIRSRCMAANLPPETPVRRVMTKDVHTIAADSPAFEALTTMTRLNVHHLPVMDGGKPVGLVSNNDLIRFESANTVYLAGAVRRCETVGELAAMSKGLPELQRKLVYAGTTPGHLGRAISSVTDAFSERLLELAEQELGPPPVPYLWVAVGSQARREQTVHSDQDHALILSDDFRPEQHDGYFLALAARVSDGLASCGFPYCPGGIMASNTEWRQPRRVWHSKFEDWIDQPARKSIMLACNFFDMRPLRGLRELYESWYPDILARAADNEIFLAHMAANALTARPPLGFFRNFLLVHGGEYDHTLDLKLRGIMPIVDLARVYALAAGQPERNTAARLRAAGDAGTLSKEGAANLVDALEFISTVRARHQAQQIRNGREPDNHVQPDELSALERGHLKDAFSVISNMQDALAQRYQTDRIV
ncbi:MAG: putative nucleotidyltransferase substrate binding domain-containing protein [Acidiferrobacteraceae bacterium]